MRLAKIRKGGHRLKEKLILFVIRVTGKREPFDVLKTLFYRPEHFGAPFSALCQAVMRGPSEWSVAERELFAAFVSKKNQCMF